MQYYVGPGMKKERVHFFFDDIIFQPMNSFSFSTTILLFSAIYNMLWITFLFLISLKPNSFRALNNHFETNPLQPISVGIQLEFQPCILHCSTSSWYFNHFILFASSSFSSKSKINLNNVTFFIECVNMIMSGHRIASIIWLRNFN